MIRSGEVAKMPEAIAHAKKFITPYNHTFPNEVQRVAGLLAYRSHTTLEPYASWYSQEKWKDLAGLFVKTHNSLLGLPAFPLLHTALTSGLSALKTPACHSNTATSSSTPNHNTSVTTSVCPICSTELNELARYVPYAHHTKSHVEHDLLLLPNNRVYGKARLEEYAAKAGLTHGDVKDLVTGDIYPWNSLKKVFIT